MFRLPPFQPCKRGLFIRRVGHHDERHLTPCCRSGAGRRDAWRLALHLAKVRRPRRVSESRGFIGRRQLQQLLQRAWFIIHSRMRIAQLRESRGNRQDGEIGRVAIGNFIPIERRRYARVGDGSDRIRRAGSSILGVLVIVEEYAVAFLLPPLGTGQDGNPALHCSRKRYGRAPNFGEGPARLDPRINVHSARAASLRPAAQSHFLEECLHLQTDGTNIVPTDARSGIKIDAQLVGMIQISRSHRMRVQLNATQVHNPGKSGSVVHDELFRCSAGWKSQRNRAKPIRMVGGSALLIERLAVGSVNESLEHQRPIYDSAESSVRDGQVVSNHIELRKLDLF